MDAATVTVMWMYFGVLGPLEVRIGQRQVNVAGRRQRLVLAALLLKANHAVGTPELIATVWDDDPPQTARRQVQNAVSELRTALTRHGGTDPIHTEPQGYRLHVEATQLDLLRFESGFAEGRRLAATQPAKAVGVLRDAVSIWRGPALAGLTGAVMQRQAARLNELRLAALEDCVDLELACGDGRGLVAELSNLVAEHPLRERLAAAFMLALYRNGRQAEALSAYQRLAAALAHELGVDPSPQLRHRYTAILRRDPALDVTAASADEAGRVRPAQLPAAAPAFVGREAHLRHLDTLLDHAGPAGPATVVISAISGTAGIGKTALAVRWAHGIADRFPDGQLYVNLRGFDPGGSVMSPAEALRGFLDAFAVPAERIPADLPAQAALYRSLLAGKRVLVVLDNARDPGQVRPLLPGTPGSLVVITSRNQLTGLIAADGAHPLTLDLLTPAEAGDLLARRLGTDRIAAEPEAVEQIIASCARLPLALVIVAARAATRPDFPLAAFAAELRRDGSGLDALTTGDPATDVRAVFSWSYRTLSPTAARLFRLLGLHPGPDISASAAASLAGISAEAIRPLLAELTRAHLLTEPTTGRYAFHDLLRVYATEQAHRLDTDVDRHTALRRMLDHYLQTAHAAGRLLYTHRESAVPPDAEPGTVPAELTDPEQALAWFTAEQPVLLTVLRHASGAGLDSQTWRLALNLATFFDHRGHWQDQITANLTALDAVGRLADRSAHADTLLSLGRAYARVGRHADAYAELRHALELFDELGDQLGQANAHLYLGLLFGQQNCHGEALHHARQALDQYRAGGELAGQARALNALGWYHVQTGKHRSALTYCQQALTLHQRLANRSGEAHAWDSLGYTYFHLGRHRNAIACYRSAIDLFRDVGDRYFEADTLARLGDSYNAAGAPDLSRRAWKRALDTLEELKHPDVDGLRAKLKLLDES